MKEKNAFQKASLFTARVWLTSPHPTTNKYRASFHSWRQEIKIINDDKMIDHRHAWMRLQQCLYNLQSITATSIIYFNLTGEEVFKIVKGKVISIQEIKFASLKQPHIILEGYKRGDGLLWKVDEPSIKEHCNRNWSFWNKSQDSRQSNAQKFLAANRVEQEFAS
jgi:hypothetical protein